MDWLRGLSVLELGDTLATAAAGQYLRSLGAEVLSVPARSAPSPPCTPTTWRRAESVHPEVSAEGYVIVIPYKLVINYGYDRVRWVSPVRVGLCIRSRNELIALEEVRPQVFQMRSQVTVEIEGDAKPVMVGENLTWIHM